MANVTLFKQDGTENGTVDLNDTIWLSNRTKTPCLTQC